MILHDLKASPGSTGKKFILRTQADTFDKEMFKLAYNPDKMYNLKFNSIDWNTIKPLSDTDKVLLDKLHTRELVGNAAREAVEQHCVMYGDLVKLICNKDLDCGVSAKTLINVFGKGFVPMFEVALALEEDINNLQFPIIAQTKYNGVRVIATVTQAGVKFQTRNGHQFVYKALADLLEHAKLHENDEFILDGELTLGLSNTSNHTDVSGIVNSALKGTPITNEGFVFTMFDTMSLSEFEAQECDEYYDRRYQNLVYRLGHIAISVPASQHALVDIAKNNICSTREEVQALFEKHLADGFEGLILKSWTHKYAFKRSKAWAKMKATKTVDLRCKGIKYGTESTKYDGLIGSLECYGNVEGRDVEVFVSSGLSDNDRTKPEYEYIGNVIELKYNSLIQDKHTLQWSLYLPRFVTIRGDIS